MSAPAKRRARLVDRLPAVRGRLRESVPLSKLTWMRVGGPAEILFRPEDEGDLAAFLAGTPADVAVTVIGAGSNLLVRDGGVRGVVVRLGRGLAGLGVDGTEITAGAGATCLQIATAARDHAIAGLEFLSGIPGVLGGALRMNAGAYGVEIKDVAVSAEALDRSGARQRIDAGDMGFAYRGCAVPADWIFTSARLSGRPGDKPVISRRIMEIQVARKRDPADPHADGRQHLRQSARLGGLETDRARRVPGPQAGRRRGLGEALQLPDQHRRGHRRRARGVGRRSAPSRPRGDRGAAGMGNSAPRGSGVGTRGTRRGRGGGCMTRHVAVLMGGWSAEREVSLVSGAAVSRSLESSGFRVSAIDVGPDVGTLLSRLYPRPDVIFNALHGRFGEDGCIQGILNVLGTPYTHSGMLASAVAMDKPLAKTIFAAAGVPVAEHVVVSREEAMASDVMERPYVVKPTNQGSSVGVHIVRVGDNRSPLTGDERALGCHVMVERYIHGKELTVTVMGDRALAVTEITSDREFYDYEAK